VAENDRSLTGWFVDAAAVARARWSMPTAPLVLVTSTTALVDGRANVRVEADYTDALTAQGLVPVVLPPISPHLAIDALRGVAGLVLTGGEDIDPAHYDESPHPATGEPHRARDACERALVEAACARRLPTLALCRGAHIANVALGGSLIQHLTSHPRGVARVHAVELEAESRLASVVATTRLSANSTHHQAIGRVAPALRVVGRSDDDVIEAIEPVDTNWWMLGVQWHPEQLTATEEDWDRRLFAAFAGAVRAANWV
jgi:putative glutamine amidotransferase